jgi:hypothetical protein
MCHGPAHLQLALPTATLACKMPDNTDFIMIDQMHHGADTAAQ